MPLVMSIAPKYLVSVTSFRAKIFEKPVIFNKDDEGVIAVLLDRFEKQELPQTLRLKEKVDQRGKLSDSDINNLKQMLADTNENKPITDRNPEYQDIGQRLRQKISDHFAARSMRVELKYIDPSYYIRSVPANVYDRFLADQMARHAAHATMAGKTGVLIGVEHYRFIHVPIPAVVSQKKRIDITGDLWRAVMHVTRQPH